MAFNYSVSSQYQGDATIGLALINTMRAAAKSWSDYITGSGSLEIELKIGSTGAVAVGGPGTVVNVGMDGPRIIYQGGAASELLTGVDPNGSAPDIVITVDTAYLGQLWLNPTDYPLIPKDKIDGYGVFLHELAHGLGMFTWRDKSTGTLPGYESTWDKLVTLNADGTAAFIGASASAAYGGPVPVTTNSGASNYAHIGSSNSSPGFKDVLNGASAIYGERDYISKIDLAIFKDLGLSVSGGDTSAVYRFYDTATNDHFYTLSTEEKNKIQATLPTYIYEGAYWATPEDGPNTIDVFRFYDTSTRGHFFTSSVEERDIVIKTQPTYLFEGVAFQVYSSDAAAGAGGVTLERFYNTETRVHHYSASADETYAINHGSAGAGWIDEGAAFIVHVPSNGMLFA